MCFICVTSTQTFCALSHKHYLATTLNLIKLLELVNYEYLCNARKVCQGNKKVLNRTYLVVLGVNKT